MLGNYCLCVFRSNANHRAGSFLSARFAGKAGVITRSLRRNALRVSFCTGAIRESIRCIRAVEVRDVVWGAPFGYAHIGIT